MDVKKGIIGALGALMAILIILLGAGAVALLYEAAKRLAP